MRYINSMSPKSEVKNRIKGFPTASVVYMDIHLMLLSF